MGETVVPGLRAWKACIPGNVDSGSLEGVPGSADDLALGESRTLAGLKGLRSPAAKGFLCSSWFMSTRPLPTLLLPKSLSSSHSGKFHGIMETPSLRTWVRD